MAAAGEIPALYDRWSESYDTDTNRTRDLAGAVLRNELDGLVDVDVVELGCGTGRNTAWLLERARSLTALDFSSGMLEKARTRMAGSGVRFVQHDIRTPLPLEDASADLVVITLVLEHVAHPGSVFLECFRVLRTGGAVFVCELHPYRQWSGSVAQFTEPVTGECTKVPAYEHSVSELVNDGLAAGLRPVRLGEWRDPADEAAGRAPRLLSVLYRR